MSIHKLSDELINKIAAGEVVERPASVVKELIENSLDAGATQIVVHLKEGGKTFIQVTDNGSGIPSEELELAVARHATSKIQNFDDLYRLETKGFRGEALASVAGVSQLSLASAFEDQDPCELIVRGGKIFEKRACAHPKGTTVTVKYLFYQTPARLKFLRTKETETQHVVDVITKMALSHSSVEFKLFQEERSLFEAPLFSDPKKRVVSLLGKDLEDYLYEFSAEGAGLKAWGYFSHPNVARSQRSQTFFFVNSRSVQDKILWHAVIEAYRDLLMRGKYPVLVLHLEVDPQTVDVNVHPTKSEVRFHHTQQVHAFVKNALREHLQKAPWVDREDGSRRGGFLTRPILGQVWNLPLPDRTPTGEIFRQTTSSQRQIEFGKTPYANMHPIGQFLGTYILCESDSKLILIDQHAAHERIGFEKLMLQYQKEGIASEPLLVSESFELKPSDAEILKKYLEEFLNFGFEIEFFGGETFVLKAQPILFKGKIDFLSFLIDVIEDIKATGELVSLKDRLHHLFATMACHPQTRSHHPLP